MQQPQPDPSPLSSVRMGPGSGGGGFAYDTPANQPVPLRQMHTSGGAGGAGVRHLSGGMGGGGMGLGLGGGGMGMPGANMGGRQSAQNDKRASLGLAYQQQAGWGRESLAWLGRGRTSEHWGWVCLLVQSGACKPQLRAAIIPVTLHPIPIPPPLQLAPACEIAGAQWARLAAISSNAKSAPRRQRQQGGRHTSRWTCSTGMLTASLFLTVMPF